MPGGRERRVVITGIGFVTPIGSDRDTVWSSLVEGASGVGPITRFDTAGYPTRIAAEVRGFAPEDHLDRKTARHTARYAQFAVAAAQQALSEAGLEPREMDPQRVGVILSSGVGGLDEIERNHRVLLEHGFRRMSPYAIPMLLADTAAGLVAIQTGALGPNFSVASACASSAHAIGEAAALIRRGDADAVIAGGAEACITPFSVGAFCQMRAMSERNHDPERAVRPWDLDRDGFVMGEGAVVFVLEDEDFASARGARRTVEIAGYGASADGYHLTSPEPTGKGAARAMAAALRSAGVEPAEVQYVNAHGTSTRLGDVAETRAIRSVFGEHAAGLKVSSTKSTHAHLLGAAGALEAAACVLAIEHGVVPPTINLDQPDKECDLDYVPNRAERLPVAVAITNSIGFGGHNATVVLRRLHSN